MFQSLRWILLIAVLVLTAAACDDNGTNPVDPGDFDPVAMQQAVDNLQNQLDDDSDMMVSLGLVAEGLAAAGGAAPMRFDRAPTPLSAKMVQSYSLYGSAAEPVLPPDLLGRVFEWSELEGHYVLSETSETASDRARFILYAIDPITKVPMSPLVQTGYLDLIDEGTDTTTRLRLTGVSGSETLVDYFIEIAYALLGENDISVEVVADGYISDGNDRLDFVLSQGATLLGSTGTLDMDLVYSLSLHGESASVTVEMHGEFDFSGDNAIETATVELRVQNGAEFVDFEMGLAADNSLDGVIKYVTEPVVYISGTEADPVFARADGEELTLEEVGALLELFDMIEDVFDVVEHIFEPFGGFAV